MYIHVTILLLFRVRDVKKEYMDEKGNFDGNIIDGGGKIDLLMLHAGTISNIICAECMSYVLICFCEISYLTSI